MPDKNSWVKN